MPNTAASLDELLRFARLGALQNGLSELEVRTILGEPVSVETYPNKGELWSYGKLEVRFLSGIVKTFGLYYAWDRGPMPKCINHSGFFPDHETTIGTIVEFLRKKEIPFEMEKGNNLKTDAGVWVLTTLENKVMSIVSDDPTKPWIV